MSSQEISFLEMHEIIINVIHKSFYIFFTKSIFLRPFIIKVARPMTTTINKKPDVSNKNNIGHADIEKVANILDISIHLRLVLYSFLFIPLQMPT